MKIQNKRLFASILFVLISMLCVAQGQGQGPPFPHPGGGPPGPPGFPIDGGVMMGVCVALFYGVKKLLSNK